MDFGLNEQQEMMQTLARDFLATEYSDKVLKAMVKDEKGYTPEQVLNKLRGTEILFNQGAAIAAACKKCRPSAGTVAELDRTLVATRRAETHGFTRG